ncbi:MAG: hypothetical protein ABFC95_00495, partial [Smithella sp.]
MNAKKAMAIAIVVFFILVIPAWGFVAGLIHPYAAFFFVITVEQTLIMLVPCLLIALLYFVLRLIFSRQKRPWAQVLLCTEGAFLALMGFGLLQVTSFYGLFVHYKTAQNNFEDVRAWGKTVEFDTNGIYWNRGSEGLPEPIARFKPMYVSVDANRVVRLSWSSGMACFGYSLVIP